MITEEGKSGSLGTKFFFIESQTGSLLKGRDTRSKVLALPELTRHMKTHAELSKSPKISISTIWFDRASIIQPMVMILAHILLALYSRKSTFLRQMYIIWLYLSSLLVFEYVITMILLLEGLWDLIHELKTHSCKRKWRDMFTWNLPFERHPLFSVSGAFKFAQQNKILFKDWNFHLMN